MRNLRNLAHYIVGFTIFYRIGNATAVNDFWLWQKIVGSIFIGVCFGGFIGMCWEKLNQELFKVNPDLKDVIRTAIGGVLGCLMACFFTDITFITFWMFYGCIALIIADLIRAKYKK
jgi:H+/Cl- antiporter ClcA